MTEPRARAGPRRVLSVFTRWLAASVASGAEASWDRWFPVPRSSLYHRLPGHAGRWDAVARGLLGHTDSATTDRYRHVLMDDIARAMAKAEYHTVVTTNGVTRENDNKIGVK